MGFLTAYTSLYDQYTNHLKVNRRLSENDQNTLQKVNSEFDLFWNNIVRGNVTTTLDSWASLLDVLSVPLSDPDRSLTYSELWDIYIDGSEKPVALPILGIVDVIDAANVTLDAGLGNIFKWPLGGDRTLDNVISLVPGQSFVIEFTQDITGTRTITLPTTWKTFGGKTENAVLSIEAGKIDVLVGYYDGTIVTFVLNLDNKV